MTLHSNSIIKLNVYPCCWYGACPPSLCGLSFHANNIKHTAPIIATAVRSVARIFVLKEGMREEKVVGEEEGVREREGGKGEIV